MGRAAEKSKRAHDIRARAEERLAQTREAVKAMPVDEAQELVYELQVHQIELELQNEELRQTQLELEASRDNYIDLYDFVPIGYLTLDPMGIILEANLLAATQLGVERRKLIPEKLEHLLRAPDQDTLHRHLEQVFSTGDRHSCELQIRTPDDTPLHVRLESIAVQTDDGAGNSCRTALIDITARKRAEQQRAQLEERLFHAEKMEAIVRLAAGIAHEFNNLLVGILSNAELLLATAERELPERFVSPLTEIVKSGERAAAMTSQLLTFARKERRTVSQLDVNRIIADAERMLRRSLGERITLRTRLAAGLRPIRADEAAIQQMIMNLAINARDAMPDGGTLTLTTAEVMLDEAQAAVTPGAHPGPHIELSVADTGCGIFPESLAHVFEPFFTTKATGHGTGLGLSTVYANVTRSGGHITVVSGPGEGTVFRVRLPQVEGTVATHADARRPGEAPRGGDETILVCDDEEIVLSSFSFFLRTFGYNVIAALGGRQALDVAAAHAGDIHLLLTDVIMPAMSGPELARNLRQLRPETKVIYMSGYASDCLESGGAEDEAAGFLQKPPIGDVLPRRVREVLDRPAS